MSPAEQRESAIETLRSLMADDSVHNAHCTYQVDAAEALVNAGIVDGHLMAHLHRLSQPPNTGSARARAAALLLQLTED